MALQLTRVGLLAVLAAVLLALVPLGECDNGDKMVFLQAVWRHGDRSPTGTYRLDQWQDNAWPQGWGQLTTRGMSQHVTLGQRLRERYITNMTYLGVNYTRSDVYVHSTDIDRTLMSAMSNLIGFYGPSSRPEVDYPAIDSWPGNYLPIPIHTVNNTEDYIGNTEAYCPRQDAVKRAMRLTPEYAALMQAKGWVFQNVSSFSGESLVDPVDEGPDWHNTNFPFWKFFDALYIESLWGLQWPDWLTQDLYNELDYIHDVYDDWMGGIGLSPVRGLNFSVEMPKLRGGSLLWSFIGNMQKKVACIKETANAAGPANITSGCKKVNKLKYYAYSAHDSTIGALFSTFHFNKSNFDTDGWPIYSSCVTVELWQKGTANPATDGLDAYYVKVLYVKPNVTDIVDITPVIIGCEQGCTLEQFANRSTPYYKENAREYCANVNLFTDGNAAGRALTMGSVPLLGLLATVLLTSSGLLKGIVI